MSSLLAKVYVKVKELPRKQSAKLEPLKRRELRSVLKIFYAEGWVDFTMEDLDYMYRMSPKICYKFVLDDKMIGVTFALLLENGVCYPNSSLISEQYRDKVKFHNEVLKYADMLKAMSKLEVIYAARWVAELYKDGMGYQIIGKIKRQILHQPGAVESLPAAAFSVCSLTEDNLAAVAEFLFDIYKSERRSILQHALRHGFTSAVVMDGTHIVGFAMRRSLPKYDQIGPVVTRDNDVAATLIAHLMALGDPERGMIIEGDAEQLPELLGNYGFDFTPGEVEELKMIRGDESLLEDATALKAIYSHYLS